LRRRAKKTVLSTQRTNTHIGKPDRRGRGGKKKAKTGEHVENRAKEHAKNFAELEERRSKF